MSDSGNKKYNFKKLAMSLDAPIVEGRMLSLPIKKPKGHTFVRVSPSEEHQYQAYTLEEVDGFDRLQYLVSPEIASGLGAECSRMTLFLSVTAQGGYFFWYWKQPKTDRNSTWALASLAPIKIAQNKWIRVIWNAYSNSYDIQEAQGKLPEPVWPTDSLEDLLDKAFCGRIIETHDHPLLRKLKGVGL